MVGTRLARCRKSWCWVSLTSDQLVSNWFEAVCKRMLIDANAPCITWLFYDGCQTVLRHSGGDFISAWAELGASWPGYVVVQQFWCIDTSCCECRGNLVKHLKHSCSVPHYRVCLDRLEACSTCSCFLIVCNLWRRRITVFSSLCLFTYEHSRLSLSLSPWHFFGYHTKRLKSLWTLTGMCLCYVVPYLKLFGHLLCSSLMTNQTLNYFTSSHMIVWVSSWKVHRFQCKLQLETNSCFRMLPRMCFVESL